MNIFVKYLGLNNCVFRTRPPIYIPFGKNPKKNIFYKNVGLLYLFVKKIKNDTINFPSFIFKYSTKNNGRIESAVQNILVLELN